MKKVVLKVEIFDDRTKTKAMKAVSGLLGAEFSTPNLPRVESVSVDMKDKKLTLTGDIDPVKVAEKLRKLCHTEIVSVGPAKEEKKKEEPKKEGTKKAEEKEKDPNDITDLVEAYKAYYSHMRPHYYYYTVQENPGGCVIC